MTEPRDPLLQALGDLERDIERDHPGAWEDVLTGRTSAAEVAASAGPSPSPEHAALASLFTGPIPAQEVDDLVTRTLASWGARPEPVRHVVVPLHRRRATWAGVAAVLAIAAALVVWRVSDLQPRRELVAYDLTLRSHGVQIQRSSDSPDVPRYLPDSTFDLVIAPERADPGPIELRVLARDGAGREVLLAPPVTRSPEGTLRLVGRLDAVLPLDPGRWHIQVLLSRPGEAPADPAAARTTGAATKARQELDLELLPAAAE